MKKLLYTFLAVSIIFSACKKEDDSPNTSTNNTPASWDCNLAAGCYDPGNGNGQYTSLAACEAVCDSVNPPSGTIIGTWELEDYTGTDTQGYIDPVLLTETVLETENYTMNTNPINLFWVYRDNGTFSEYQFNNDTISYYQHYDYVKNGDEVSITFEGDDVMTWTVTSLTSNNLNVSREDYETNDNGNDTTMFYRSTVDGQFIKSELPSITTETLNKKKPVSSYNSFLNRRGNR